MLHVPESLCCRSTTEDVGALSNSLPGTPRHLFVSRTTPDATLPSRATEGSAGYDLSCSTAVEIAPRSRAVVPTGLIVKIPTGCYGRVAPRSGLAVKYGIDVGAGVIDSDYRGEVGVVIFNHGDEPISLPARSRIAQLIIEHISTPQVVEISQEMMRQQETTPTTRGARGFGSTGITAAESKTLAHALLAGAGLQGAVAD